MSPEEESQEKVSRRGFIKILCGGCAAAVGGVGIYYLLEGNQGGTVEKYVAKCGFNCIPCDGYKQKTCLGCNSTTGPYSDYILNVCQIRPCAIAKGFENCAPCPDYNCDKLRVITDYRPHAKAALDEIRRQLGL